MTPGSSEFQKYLRLKHPMREGERMGEYLYRLSTTLRIKQSRMKDLWYGSYGKCTDDFNKSEREKLFTSFVPEAKHPHLNDLKTKLEEQDKNISRLEKILERETVFKRKLGELLASH